MQEVCTGFLASSVQANTQDMRPWMISLNGGLQWAGVSSVLKPVWVYKRDGKRLDVFFNIFPFSNGRSSYWDFIYADSYTNTYIYSSAVAVGHIARETKEQKRWNYDALEVRFRFQLIVVETTDVYREFTATLKSETGRYITEVTGERRETLCVEETQSEIIADAMHNYRRISEIMHGYRLKFGDNNYSRRSYIMV